MVKSSIFKYVQQNIKYINIYIHNLHYIYIYITVVPAPDDGCQRPKHVELPTEM